MIARRARDNGLYGAAFDTHEEPPLKNHTLHASRALGVAAVLSLSSAILAGCPGGAPNAAPDAGVVAPTTGSAAAPTPSASGTAAHAAGTAARPAASRPPSSSPSPSYGATNADAVTRFDDERPLGEVKDHVNFDMRARTAPTTHDSDVITVLTAGTAVRKVARRGQWFLVLFADPHDKASTLMAWTWEQAFFPLSGPGDQQKLCACWTKIHDGASCDAVAGMATGECDRTYGADCEKLVSCVNGDLAPKCMPNERLLSPQNVCARTCTRNADCPNDQICTDTMGKPDVCRAAKVSDGEATL
jgi:hypothetical protein